MNLLDNTKNFINSGGKRIREKKIEKKIMGFSILLLIVLLFFSTAGFQDRLIQGWYQQWLPDLNGSSIKDITFLDSLTGFAVTNVNSQYQGYILKTTNGGDNWTVKLTYNPPYTNVTFIKVYFVNDSTGYACSDYIQLFKTTNKGENWSTINTYIYPEDIAIINNDTMITVKSGGFDGGVYRTTNGGSNWQLIWTNGTAANPTRIYMINKDLGFHTTENLTYFRRTTNGGLNWTDIDDIGFSGISFYDTLIGWKGSIEGIKKTTNGGLNWFSQSHTWIYNFGCLDICAVNKDTVWFVGSSTYTNWYRGVIFVTTNGGYSWGYQLPDTSIHIGNYEKIRFTNKNNGWAYFATTGVHTNTGGNDTTYISHMNNQTVNLPGDYSLYQNFPNPFNASTEIKYKISKSADVRISVYNIRGQEIKKLTNKRHSAGIYNLIFDGSNLPSGVYFYVLFVNSEKKDIRKMILVK